MSLMVHTVDLRARYVHRLLARLTLLFGTSTGTGYAGRKGASFTSGINPSGPGNSPITAKKPATESPLAQGHRESSNPPGMP